MGCCAQAAEERPGPGTRVRICIANGPLRDGDRARARWPETAGTAGAGTIGHWPSTVGFQQCGSSLTGGIAIGGGATGTPWD